MRSHASRAVLLLTLLASAVAAQPPDLNRPLPEPTARDTLELAPLDLAKLRAEDAAAAGKPGPFRYAVPKRVAAKAIEAQAGGWTPLKDGRVLRRWKVQASDATSLDFGFSDYWLPAGAELWVYDADRTVLRGPYTDQHNRAHRELWTPYVPGDTAYIEVTAPAALKDYVSFHLDTVHQGYRIFWDSSAKSASCNVDVICPAGDPYRDQIRSVARITVGGGLCSGQMINNTAEDNTPYFLTANHCGIGSGNASSVVFLFNYESDTCRSGSASGTPLSTSGFNDTLTGSSFVAANGMSDFTLVQLSSAPPDSFNVHWAGWDNLDVPATMAFGIHHPSGDAKRLAIENQPIEPGMGSENFGPFSLQEGTYWEVTEWDVGITEGGSSGSGLFNQDKRLVGQLAGGAFFNCPGAEEGSDFYGRFSVSWDAGSTPQTRLRDWLDPGDTGATVLDGIDSCDAPDVSIDSSANPAQVGETIQLTANVTGGQAPYSFAWDVDGDGEIDADSGAVGVSFPDAPPGNIRLTVTDAASCSRNVSFGQVVQAPRVEVSAIGNPTEQCGDGDADIEPGEFWSFPVTLRNNGDATAEDAFAAFAVSPGNANAKRTVGPDDFGYRLRDSSEPGCDFDFQDISSSGSNVSFVAASTFDANDDGGAQISLGGPGVDIYGSTVQSLLMSSNGYLSTSGSDGGGDFSSDCGLPVTPSHGGGARLYAMHDDLITGSARHQYFADCPRPGEAGGSGCNIFQWNNVSQFNNSSLDASFQAILYDDTNQLVYQYGDGSPDGSAQSIGLQNAAASDGLQYACDEAGSIGQGTAVCVFHPSASGPQQVSDGIFLETSSASLGNLAPGATRSVNLTVQFSDELACGSLFGIDYLGTGHDRGFANDFTANIVTGALGGNGGCDNTTACASAFTPQANLKQGFWFKADRPGNGIDLHFIGDQMYSAWYTAEPGRVPVWYYVQTLNGQARSGDQIRADILKFSLVGDIRQNAPTFETVGEAVFSFIDDSTAVMSWIINGQRGGELLQFFDLDVGEVNGTITDQWFNPAESGWGLGVHQQGGQEFNAVYFYGTDGEPRWVVTLDNLVDDGSAAVAAFEAHCPGCAWLPPESISGGTLSRSYDMNGTGVLDLDVSVAGDEPVSWLREAFDIQRINPPAK